MKEFDKDLGNISDNPQRALNMMQAMRETILKLEKRIGQCEAMLNIDSNGEDANPMHTEYRNRYYPED